MFALSLFLFPTTVLTAASVPGDLDPTYGNGGKVTTDFQGGENDHIWDAVVQPDGKLVAVCNGEGTDRVVRWGLVRYRLDGSLDPTFGNSGKVVITTPVWSLNAVIVQPDGKIVVSGAIVFNTNRDFLVIRFNKNGSLDTGFGNGGMATADFFQTLDEAWDLALQPDGKIVASGRAHDGLLALARFNPDGSLDGSFGNLGKVAPGLAPGEENALAVAVQSDGKIVAGGVVSGDFLLARFNQNGTLDLTFGDGGKVFTDFDGRFDFIDDVIIQPDGKIVAAGQAGVKFALARYNEDGSLDNNFGSGGKVTTVFLGASSASSTSVVLQRDGKIVAAGYAWKPSNDIFISSFALARYNPDGSLDNTFGDQGKVITSFGQSSSFATALVLQPDDKLVAAGSSTADLALARYLTAPLDVPVLQTEAGSNHAIALESVTFRRDPFSVSNDSNFSADHRTRIILFAINLTLGSGENSSAVTVQAEDGAGVHNLPVEFVGQVPGSEWLTQVVVKLPDGLANGNVSVSTSFHGNTSNKPFIVIQ